MDILNEHYAGEDSVLVFNSATSHTEWADGALSAYNMPKSTQECGVEVNLWGPDKKSVYGPNGKLLKHKIKMEDATFGDGSPK